MYRRNLPHWQPSGKSLFVTWRLAGSHTKRGPYLLRVPDVAECVLECIQRDAGAAFDLHAFVIMPDHVHILISPGIELARITNAIKGRSARRANVILGRSGEPFWQDESFDHWIRNSQEFWETKAYIENNPVRAGLVAAPEQWPYSSAALEATG